MAKQLEQQTQEINQRLEETSRQLVDSNSKRAKLQSECHSLAQKLEESEGLIEVLTKQKQQFGVHIEQVKLAYDEQIRLKQHALQQLKNLGLDFAALKHELEEERLNKSDIEKQLGKVHTELYGLKAKQDRQFVEKDEELEDAQKKFATKLSELNEQLDETLNNCHLLEKAKTRLQNEKDDLVVSMERAMVSGQGAEKKLKQADKLVEDYRKKLDELHAELDLSRDEVRQFYEENLRLRTQVDFDAELLEKSQRDHKALTTDIAGLVEQLNSGESRIVELENNRKKLEADKNVLEQALEAGEEALKHSELLKHAACLDVANTRQEWQKILVEKDEEIQVIRL